MTSDLHHAKASIAPANEGLDDLKADMSIQAGTWVDYGKPVHESLTLSALINSEYRLDSNTTYRSLRDRPTSRPEINDFIRGVMWNDDPECELFNNSNGNNLDYSTGMMFGIKFKSPGFAKSQLIKRSHFGDLQWLHAMAEGMDKPQDTKNRIFIWMEVMYNVATGILDPNTALNDTPLRGTFNDPANYNTVGELLTHRHSSPAVIPHRALGSCFHVIQDSYAIGHTWRERLNKSASAGEPDRWGAIRNFHSYGGQNEDQHKHFDHGEEDISSVDLRNPDSWNKFSGCRDGLDRCITLANFWHLKATWTEVREWLDTVVFVISDKATTSDSGIETE